MNNALKYVGNQINNEQYPFKVEKVLILPKHEEAIDIIEASDLIIKFNTSSNSMVKVLKDNGFGERDLDYFVYSGYSGKFSQEHLMQLDHFIALL